MCVDVLNVVFSRDFECHCKRPEHSGEPLLKQIKDPFTGAVHAPRLVIDENGDIRRNDEKAAGGVHPGSSTGSELN